MLHPHKNTITQLKFHSDGRHLLPGSRDQLVKLFDMRKLGDELRLFKAHKKDVTSLAWHPVHTELFASGGHDGAIHFWSTLHDEPLGSAVGQYGAQAHEGAVWSLAWHPLGHLLCSGANDHTTKFWCRGRPGAERKRDAEEIEAAEEEERMFGQAAAMAMQQQRRPPKHSSLLKEKTQKQRRRF